MSGFNTKTPTMDFSPWLKRDFSTQNRGGALAEAFQIAADLRDAYGQTADKNLLSQITNETDISKVPQDFYDKQNALKAKSIIETNKNLAFQDEQRKRTDELNARSDAEYYTNQFTKEAIGDVWNMDKESYDAKYANAGGLDKTQVQNAWNMKEDRNLSLEDRNRQIELHNLNVQNTRNSMARANEEYNYNKQQREQNKTDNDFLIAFESGYIPEAELDTYKGKVSPSVFNGVMKQKQVNDITNKYNTLEEFRNSEEWKTTPYEVKNEIFKSKVYDRPRTAMQERMEQDYINSISEISSKLGTDDLSNVDFEQAVADGKITRNDMTVYAYKLAKAPASKEVDKKMISGDFNTINYGAETFAKLFNNKNHDTGVFENAYQQFARYFPDMAIGKNDLADAEFRSVFSGFAATFLKLQSGATVTDKERENFYNALGSLSANKKINAVGVLNKLNEAKSRLEAVKSASPEYFNLKYGKSLTSLNNSISSIGGFLEQKPNPNDKKINWQNKSEIPSTGNNNSTNVANELKVLNQEEINTYGITFQ